MLIGLSPGGDSGSGNPKPPFAVIAQLPERVSHGLPPPTRPDNRPILKALYSPRDGAPLWSRSGLPTLQAQALLDVLSAAESYGLAPEDYGAANLTETVASLQADRTARPDQWLAFDIALSNAALMFLHDLHFGRVNPRAAQFDMPERKEYFDDSLYLEQLAGGSNSAAVIAQAEPNFLHYRLLRQALARYRALVSSAHQSPLPRLPGRSVAPGQPYTGAPALRRLLVALGDLSPDQEGNLGTTLDVPLDTALKRFQYLHGLRESGILDAPTYAALTVPLAQRVRQMELTLERWRWVPPLQASAIIVNIPQFRLFLFRSAVDRESGMLRMNVIVGKAYPELHTPVFASEIKAVLFRPSWNVPSSIARRELLPLLRKNPHYLDKENLELVINGSPTAAPLAATSENLQALAAGRLRLRQRPGPDNALGLIKFVVPNSYSVYLHSTPAQRLFDEPRRAFSHGCIRVSDPVALAVEALRGTPGDWTAQKIRAAMDGNSTFQVNLTQPVQVLILYGTAIATEDGAVHFFEDIYGEDRRLEELLGLKPLISGT